MEVTKSYSVLPITAICTCYCDDISRLLIFAGMGGWLLHNSPSCTSITSSKLIFPYHSIHGIKQVSCEGNLINLYVWGDKSMVSLLYQRPAPASMAIVPGDEITTKYQLLDMDDLILDCHRIRIDERETIAVGYAHNFVDIFAIDEDNSYVRLTRCQCQVIVVLFSMSFYGDSINNLIIASGTAFGEIYLWQLHQHATNAVDKGKILSHTKAHEGVIFRMKWSAGRRFIASVSDDRTVRLWRLSSEYALESMFTGWGHISRLWDVAFIHETGFLSLATSSEDGTLKIWDMQGKCTATLRGHEGSVWRIEFSHAANILVSGGNDAAIKTWNPSFYQYTCPELENQSSVLVSIPRPLNCPPSDPELVGNAGDTNASKSSRLNGVCNVFMNLDNNVAVVILSSGTIWLLKLNSLDSSSGENDADKVTNADCWHHLLTLDKPITSSHMVVTLQNIHMAITHHDGSVSVFSLDPESLQVSGLRSWHAHPVRAVNIWILNTALIMTASVNGSCRLWGLQEDHYEMIVDLFTGRNEIATSCHLISMSMDLSGISTGLWYYLLIGDARGSLSIYLVDLSAPFSLVYDEKALPLYPIAFHPRLHGTDPITRIVEGTDSMIISAGLDGFINIYRCDLSKVTTRMRELLQSLDIAKRTSKDALDHLYSEKSLTGRVLGQHKYPFNPLLLKSKLSSLPIKSTDDIIVRKTSSETSILIAGYVGSTFIIWDIVHKTELLRVEAGGYRRPHHCDLQYFSDQSANARIGFLCPIPKAQDTLISLIDTSLIPAAKFDRRDEIQSLSLTTMSHGKVSYAGSIVAVETVHGLRSYAFIGGELGNLLVFEISNSHRNHPQMNCSQPIQHVDMPSNVSVKALTSRASSRHPRTGLLLATGGRLRFAIWKYDFSSISDRYPKTSPSDSDSVLCQISTGSLWLKATQDHRALAADIITVRENIHEDAESFIIMICDSRGVISLGYLQLVDNDADDSMKQTDMKIIHHSEVSSYPILCCRLLAVPHDSMVLAIVGDTSGVIIILAVVYEQTTADG
jgi:WD40 repeat protein